jgi:hypothetical protein
MKHAIGGSLAAVLALFAATNSASAADIVRWVDSAGVTHYSDDPPPGVKSVRIQRALVPDAGSQQQAASDAKRVIDASRRMEADRILEQARKNPNLAAQGSMARAKRCDHARYQLALLREAIPVFRTASGGARVYVDDAARPSEIQRWSEEEKTQCDAAALETSAAQARRRSEAAHRPACKAAVQRGMDLDAALPRASEKDLAQARQAAQSACF